MNQEELLNKFNQTDSATFKNKESEKNTQEDEAQRKLNVAQINNKTQLGTFAVGWVINAVAIISILILALVCVYIFNIALEQEKLEILLINIYGELTAFIEKYQAALAALITLMFGEKLKRSNKK